MLAHMLPILAALPWMPADMPMASAPAMQHRADQQSQATETITCPLTGEQIPSCCCPVKK